MNENSIIIHQTLHGYSNGHHLLESSVLLSDDSKRRMDILSDLSGTDAIDGFSFYYSGYLLENEELVVLAKTWYAPEMSRPGCVWTHSLLIPIQAMTFCASNIDVLITEFKRPSISESQTKYSESLVINRQTTIVKKYDAKKIEYLIWIMIGHTPPNYVVAKDSEEFIKELLFIWFTCYSQLSYDYSFITRTNFLKIDNSNLISLQFCLKQVRNNLSHSSNNITLMKSIDDVQKFPQWVINTHGILINGEWGKLLEFKELLCDVSLGEVSLTSFIKLYSCFYNGKNSIEIYASLELIDKLLKYLLPAIYRIKNNFYLNKSLDFNEINIEIFNKVKEIAEKNQHHLKEPLRDEEIFYVSKYIEEYLEQKKNKKISLKELLKLVQQNARDVDDDLLAEDIKEKFGMFIDDDREEETDYGLIRLLGRNRIYVSHERITFSEALETGLNILLKEKCIKEKSIYNLKDMVEKFGRYLFIDKRILFCYDKEKENCLKPGITLIISKKGIKVDEEEDADILFLLAARNKIEHLKVISELIRLIEKKKLLNEIIGLEKSDEIRNKIKKLLKE